jgi:hypothetical protein
MEELEPFWTISAFYLKTTSPKKSLAGAEPELERSVPNKP